MFLALVYIESDHDTATKNCLAKNTFSSNKVISLQVFVEVRTDIMADENPQGKEGSDL